MAKEALKIGRQNQQTIADHLVECTDTRRELREAQRVTDGKVEDLLVMQQHQTATLNDIRDVLPWLKQTYEGKKARDRAWRAAGDVLFGIARKNWDSISGKLIFIAFAGYMVWRDVPWTEAVKFLAP